MIEEAKDLSRLRAGLHFGFTILIKILAGLVVIKVLAWKLGPEGFGVLGQLMTLAAIVGMLAGGGISNGLIKVLAKTPITEQEGRAWFGSAFTMVTIVSIAFAVLLSLFSGALSDYFLPSVGAGLFIILAVSQIIIALGNLPLAEVSSRGDVRSYSRVNVLGTLLGAALVVAAACYGGLVGAAYAVLLMPAMIGVVALAYVVVWRRQLLSACGYLFDLARIKHLMLFSLVTLVGALSVPLAQLFIRDVMARAVGWDQVGLWQAVVKLSDVYMQFVGVVLLNFVLPRYSAAADMQRVFKEWLGSLSALLVVLLIGFFVIFVLRQYIVKLVFSADFLPMLQYLLPQMVGDTLRTVAASISYIYMSRGLLGVSVAFELMQGVLLALAFSYFFGASGGMAPVYAHVFTYAVLSVLMGLGLLIWMKRKA